MLPFAQGLTMGLAYVAPIGMQNLFVIDAALARTRRDALLTAAIVAFFDISLSLACFLGVGSLMTAYPWLERAVLGLGGAIVVRIGVGLLSPSRDGHARERNWPLGAEGSALADSHRGGADGRMVGGAGADTRSPRGWLGIIGTACVVTWFNPQALIDGTMMLGAFAASLRSGQHIPFAIGMVAASMIWFPAVALLVAAFAHRLDGRAVNVLNRVCGAVIAAYGVKLLVDFVRSVM